MNKPSNLQNHTSKTKFHPLWLLFLLIVVIGGGLLVMRPFARSRAPHYVVDSVQIVLELDTAHIVPLSAWMPTYPTGFFRDSSGRVEVRLLRYPILLGGVSRDSILSALHLLRDSIDQRILSLDLMDSEKRYYANTHTVIDEGYNQVMALFVRLEAERDSLRSLSKSLQTIDSVDGWRVTMRHRITLNALPACTDSFPMLPVLPLDTSGYYYQTVLKGDTLWHGLRLQFTLSDCLGPRLTAYYQGDLDSLQQPFGEGVCYGNSYYEGEWKAGMREGLGIGLIPGHIVSVGMWKENKFKGEKIVYNVNRVYGIDISHYQHKTKVSYVKIKRGGKRPKGKHRKRRGRSGRYKKVVTVMPITWKNVRITHLGYQSKKDIDGRTDYPVSFCYIKATQGVKVKSNYSTSDAVAARRQGIHVGHYHFFSATNGTRQAYWFLRNANIKKGDMPPVLDVELTPGQIAYLGGKKAMMKQMMAWVKVVKKHCGTMPILYISQKFLDRYLDEMPDELRACPVWIAHYSQYRPSVQLAFWQLSCDGNARGIHGLVDIDVFNGTHEQFETFVKEHCVKQ